MIELDMPKSRSSGLGLGKASSQTDGLEVWGSAIVLGEQRLGQEHTI